MNRVIKLLMISDILILTSFGLIEPVLAIFFKENLVGGSIFMAGIASMIFLLVKSAVQLPFSKYVDAHHYYTRVKWLIFGSFLISVVPFVYMAADHIYVILMAQVLNGVGSGLAYPTWLGLWSTHLDKHQESFEWSLYSTCTGVGTAATAAIGAAMAQYVGFEATFFLVGVLSLAGCVVLFALDKKNGALGAWLDNDYHKKRKLVDGKRNV